MEKRGGALKCFYFLVIAIVIVITISVILPTFPALPHLCQQLHENLLDPTLKRCFRPHDYTKTWLRRK